MRTLVLLLILASAVCASPGEMITISGYAAVGGEVQSMAGATMIEVSNVVPQVVYTCGAQRTRKGVVTLNPVAAGQRVRVLVPAMLPRLTLEPHDGVWTADGRLFSKGEILN